MENQIVIGKIVAPHGVRGDIRILPLTDKPEQFLDLDYLLLPDGRKLTVKAARFHKRMVLVTTAEIKSMNESELLRGMEVSINAEDLPELEEGRFYVADLIGLPVYDEQGEQIGTFKDALSTGSNDVYVIAVPGQKDYLLPALKKYVKEINLAEKRIVVELPEWVEAEWIIWLLASASISGRQLSPCRRNCMQSFLRWRRAAVHMCGVRNCWQRC